MSRLHPRSSTVSVAVAAALLVASVANPRWFGPTVAGADAALSLPAHLVGYAVLAAAVTGVPPFGGRRGGAVAAALVAAGYGAGIEVLQLGLTYRTGGLVDLTVNGVGAGLGATIRVVRRRLRASSHPADTR
jgi:VanZ family protein